MDISKKTEAKVLQTKNKCDIIHTKDGFLLCPKCGRRTDQKIMPTTVAEDLPVFCKKCKQTSIVNITSACATSA